MARGRGGKKSQKSDRPTEDEIEEKVNEFVMFQYTAILKVLFLQFSSFLQIFFIPETKTKACSGRGWGRGWWRWGSSPWVRWRWRRRCRRWETWEVWRAKNLQNEIRRDRTFPRILAYPWSSLQSKYNFPFCYDLSWPFIRNFIAKYICPNSSDFYKSMYICIFTGHRHHTERGWTTTLQVVSKAHQKWSEQARETLLVVWHVSRFRHYWCQKAQVLTSRPRHSSLSDLWTFNQGQELPVAHEAKAQRFGHIPIPP